MIIILLACMRRRDLVRHCSGRVLQRNAISCLIAVYRVSFLFYCTCASVFSDKLWLYVRLTRCCFL